MLWQPTLPEQYLKPTPSELAVLIAARRKQLGSDLVILGHHYQTDEVIQHADFTGDSLKLSQLAAQKVAEQHAKYVIFCGVHFMAETADLLTPDGVSVILPDLSAGCSMADMADYDDALVAWESLHAGLKQSHGGRWNGRIIPVTYINSSAAIKAFVGANDGCVCTSSNAQYVLEWALAGGVKARGAGEEIKVLFLPDQHLGRNTSASMGMNVEARTTVYDPKLAQRGETLGGATPKQLDDATVILWAGHCSVHKLFRPEHIQQIRSAEAALPPKERTTVIVHPECAKDVVDLADLAGSTEYIINTVNAAAAGTKWAIGTEVHLVTRLSRAAAARGVRAHILSECQCLCTTMYRIDQPHLLWVLDNLVAGKVVNQIAVHPGARELALRGLKRMLSLTALGAKAPAVKVRVPVSVSAGAGD